MPTNVLTDAQPASFRGIDFMAHVVEWSDSRKYRGAVHEYLKRDGAEIEHMGRAPHRTRLSLVYIGKDWRKEHLRLVAAVDENPRGLLIHPLYGAMNVYCEGFDPSVNVEQAIDTVLVPVSFVEDAINQRLDAPESTPTAKAATADTYSAQLSAFSSVFPLAAAAVGAAQVAIARFTAAARAAAAGTPDPSSPNLYGAVVSASASARASLVAAASSNVAAFEATSTLELALAACADVDAALADTRPAVFTYTVPALTSLLAVAQQHYRSDARARMNEIRAMNAGRYANEAAIPAGTRIDLILPSGR